MKKKETCDRCGKTLRAETKNAGPDTPVRIDQTGESICGECLMKMISSMSPPVDDNYETKEFLRNISQDLATQVGIDESKLSLRCEQFLSHDVHIQSEKDVYKIELLYDLIEDHDRWSKARAYLLSWIAQHPPIMNTQKPKASRNTKLARNGKFVFIFLPENYPKVPDSFAPKVALEISNLSNKRKVGWMLQPVFGGEEYQAHYAANIVNQWTASQKNPDSLNFSQKILRFKFSPQKCFCIIAE